MSSTPVTRTVAAYAVNAPGKPTAAYELLDAARRALAAGRLTELHREVPVAVPSPGLAVAFDFGGAAALGISADVREDPPRALPLMVAATSLAVAHGRDIDQRDLAVAVSIGAEVGVALAQALGPRQRAQGWDVIGADGAVAAAVAVGRLDGLPSSAMVHAIGLAATQSAGLAATTRDDLAASVVWGKAAMNGVEAAALARFGVTAAPAALEGRRGLAALTAGDTSAALAIAAALGGCWPADQ